MAGATFEITPLKLVIGSLIVLFALLELSKKFQEMALPPQWLPLGGAISGFFGGLSGNQGALRTPFLLKAGLSKEAFIATGVLLAVIVDIARLIVYGSSFLADHLVQSTDLAIPITVATTTAFAGAFFGKHILGKVTYRTVQVTVAIAMFLIGAGLMTGIV